VAKTRKEITSRFLMVLSITDKNPPLSSVFEGVEGARGVQG
jgi:hypothetical protein